MNIFHWHLFGERPGMNVPCPYIHLGYENAAPGTFSVSGLALPPNSKSEEGTRRNETGGQGWALPGGEQGGASSFLTHWLWAKAIRWASGKHDHDLPWGSMGRLNHTMAENTTMPRTPNQESWAPALRSWSAVTWFWDLTSLPWTSSMLCEIKPISKMILAV